MSKQLTIKKSNALINASYTISLAEQRMILLAIATAGGRADVPLKIEASAYSAQFGVSRNTAYESLREASITLFDRRFTFQEEDSDGKLKTTVSRWVSHVSYAHGGGYIELMFSPHVQPLLCELERKFTHYALDQVSDLTSVYAIRLYELLIAWRSKGKTPVIDLSDFRHRLGVDDGDYPRMTDFKRWVLDAAIKQINENTDINATYEQRKQGRSITGFSFSFSIKNPELSALEVRNDGVVTEKPKRKTITKSSASQLAKPGETWEELYKRLSRDYIIS